MTPISWPRVAVATVLALLALWAAVGIGGVGAGVGERPVTTEKAPYLIWPGENTEMRVLWQLTDSAPCVIEWGLDASCSAGSETTVEHEDHHQHTYAIGRLTPGTGYCYRVTTPDAIYEGSFVAAPDASATAVKFFAYGDTRSYPGDHDVVASAMVSTFAADPEFQSLVIVVGDLVQDGDSELDWNEQFFDPAYAGIQSLLRNLPYQSAMGNHEESGQLFMRYFPYPYVAARYWSFDYGPAHFVVVDQYSDYSPGSAQLDWIENDLATSTKPWKFVYFHEPGWSAGGGHENLVAVQDYIHPLCLEYGVRVVFAGHNHYYARADVDGVQHVTTGGGGAPIREPDPGYPFIVTTAAEHHFCKVEIDGEELRFEAVAPDGTVLDAFALGAETSVAACDAPDPIVVLQEARPTRLAAPAPDGRPAGRLPRGRPSSVSATARACRGRSVRPR